ncbi:hypothetical protein [Halegenticoccus tardaugens]|uniref:hypothetical protein n=1 Tax=Halegenticoccus tardaugens TaxID=2071624 RepID=UPI001E2BF61B|nr:hypothetical protein [Halegenticoccus tardaugens]
MIGYSLMMLLNQALVRTTGSANWGMSGGMGPGTGGGMGSSMTSGMGWDLGMVALAILMLISGVIMTSRRDTEDGM